MVATIHLYDETSMPRNEVYNIVTYDMLSQEFLTNAPIP